MEQKVNKIIEIVRSFMNKLEVNELVILSTNVRWFKKSKRN